MAFTSKHVYIFFFITICFGLLGVARAYEVNGHIEETYKM